MKRKLVLALMLVLMLLMLVPFEALAQEIVDDNIAILSYSQTSARKNIQALGLLWSFYKDTDDAIKFKTSSDDGATWSSTSTIRTGSTYPTNSMLSVYVGGSDSSHIHITYVTDSSSHTYYRRGTLYSNGTIIWLAEQLYPFVGVYVQVAADTNGYPWIGGGNNGTGGSNIYITKSSTNDGTWVTEAGYKLLLDSMSAGGNPFRGSCIPVPLTNGKLVAVWQYGWGTAATNLIKAQRYTGSSWGSVATSTLQSIYGYQSVVGQDDDAHIVALEGATYDIEYLKYSYSTNSFGGYTTLYSAATSTSAPVISMDNGNNLHVFWENDPTDDHMYYAKYIYDESTWVSYYDLIDEIDDLPATGYYLNTDYTCDESRVGVYYIAGTTILKFKLLDEVLHVDTLDASPIGATTATLRGEIVSLGFGSATERGFWINDTPSLSGATQEGNETGTFNVGVFTHGITGLTEGLKYYYCTYASNAYGLEYGTWSQFTAGGSAGGIAVLTLDPTDVGDFEATFNGNIVATGGGYLTMRGFQYGHSDTPTWLWDEGGNFTVGTFAYTPTDLEADSIYYVRAIAGNGTDTDYGQWIGFITEQPSYVPGEGNTYADLITAPIPTTAPGGWIRPGKDYNGFPIISPLINTFADLGFGRSFFWFVVEVFCIIVLTLIGARFTKNLPITFGILLVLFLLPFIAFEYLDWWMLAPFLVVGGALCIKEGQFSWS
jgi:hypothetical protein